MKSSHLFVGQLDFAIAMLFSDADFTRCSSLMSTNMVAFLLLIKHREVNKSKCLFETVWAPTVPTHPPHNPDPLLLM